MNSARIDVIYKGSPRIPIRQHGYPCGCIRLQRPPREHKQTNYLLQLLQE